MIPSSPNSSSPLSDSKPAESKLPVLDWLLLPLLSLSTIALLIVPAELVARRLYGDSQTTLLKCLVMNDPSTGVRAIPNCVCRGKIVESAMTEIRYNSCGHRAGMECGPKPAGTFRIVLLGSSFDEGLWVPRDQTFAALLPADLSRRTGRHIELYNESMQWGSPHSMDLRFNEALAAQPDMILWAITPWDIDNADVTVPDVTKMPGRYQQALAPATKSVSHPEHNAQSESQPEPIFPLHSALFLQHCLYKSQSQYLKASLLKTEGLDYIHAQDSAAWTAHLNQFETYAADISSRAKKAGIPLVFTVLPLRLQAIMIANNQWPAGFNPYKLGSEVQAIAARRNATCIDLLHQFRDIPHSDQYYYPVDGHINATGHRGISALLAQSLTAGAVDGLKPATPMSFSFTQQAIQSDPPALTPARATADRN